MSRSRVPAWSFWRTGALLALGALGLLLLPLAEAQTTAQTITTENQNAGDGNWAATVNYANGLEAYSLKFSLVNGESISYRVNANVAGTRATLIVYRIGYYQGFGAREMYRQTNFAVPVQPACQFIALNRLVYDCSQWTDTVTIPIGANWVSGLYQVNWYVAGSVVPSSQSWFVVRKDNSAADILYVIAEHTHYAYNLYGGASAYRTPNNPQGWTQAPKSSLNRPWHQGLSLDQEIYWKSPRTWDPAMINFLESNGYSVTYAADEDFEKQGIDLLNNRKVFLTNGHDEYWTGYRRTILEVARARNLVHQVYFSSNVAYWQIYFENNDQGDVGRLLNHYKDSQNGVNDLGKRVNPVDLSTPNAPSLGTDLFKLPEINRPEMQLMGLYYVNYAGPQDCSNVVAVNTSDLYWANTGVSNGAVGTCLSGYEFDDFDAATLGVPGAVMLFKNPITLPGLTSIVQKSIRYTWPASGCKVLATGSNDYAYGLVPPSNNRGFYNFAFDPAAKYWRPIYQLTYNMFKDMGATPTTPNSILTL